MKQAVIYGGAFNPPTLAHHAILQACFDYAQKHNFEVWILPCGNRSDKSIDVPIRRRLELIRALVKDVEKYDVNYRILDIELKDKQQTDTYRTYQNLKKQFPNYSQNWVFGSDSVNSMNKWNNGIWLFNNLHMLIINRPGSGLSRLPQNATLIDHIGHDISSTEVRKLLKNNEPIKHLVTPKTHALLIDSGIS